MKEPRLQPYTKNPRLEEQPKLEPSIGPASNHPDRNTLQRTPSPFVTLHIDPQHIRKPVSSRPSSSVNQTLTQCEDLDRPSRVLRAKYSQHQKRRPRSHSTPAEDEFLNIETGTYDYLLHSQDPKGARTAKETSTSIRNHINTPQVSPVSDFKHPDTASDITRTTEEHGVQNAVPTTTTEHSPRYGTTPGQNDRPSQEP